MQAHLNMGRNSLVSKIHKCEYIPKNGVYLKKDYKSNLKNASWSLIIQCVALEDFEDDLEPDAYLPIKGDVLWETVVEIHNCPYCGVELNSSPSKSKYPEGLFHVEYSEGNIEYK